jgi:hypothetical protein
MFRRLKAWVAAQPLQRLALGIGLIALAVSGLFGGLKPVKEAKLAAVEPGVFHKGKPWTVAVVGARLVDQTQAPLAARRAGDRFIAVRATVEITADRSRRDLDDILQLSGVDGLRDKKPASVYLLRDNAPAAVLHPGLPDELIFFWEQAPAAAVPATVEVQIAGKKQRADSLSGRRDWFDRAAKARVRVAVEDRRQPS